jgi:hypothetical protein
LRRCLGVKHPRRDRGSDYSPLTSQAAATTTPSDAFPSPRARPDEPFKSVVHRATQCRFPYSV